MKIRAKRAGTLGACNAMAVAIITGAVSGMMTETVHAGGGKGPRGTAARGNVSFVQDGNRTFIHASDGSIINYASFNIGRNETVQFVQPHQLARVLNRINGGTPSRIDGQLLSNGIVYLVNPSGVVFGQDSVIDTNGFFAAAGSMSDNDFLNNRDRFTNLTGDIVNYGSITGSQVHLIGSTVANHGNISASNGLITMLAGDSVYIRETGDRLTVRVDGKSIASNNGPTKGHSSPNALADAAVVNTGSVNAANGQVMFGAGDLVSLAIRNEGDVNAAGGDVTMSSLDGAIINEGNIDVSVANGVGGNVLMQGPSVVNSGSVLADAANGTAGMITLHGRDHAYNVDGGLLSAAGTTGSADGGSVYVLASRGLAGFQEGSHIDVSGGVLGGNGGFAEVSGESVIFGGTVDLRGDLVGELLIDPEGIKVVEFGNAGDELLLGDGSINFTEGTGVLEISSSSLDNVLGDITLEATDFIDVLHPILLTGNQNLTLHGKNYVNIYAPITGANNLRIRAKPGLPVTEEVRIEADININGGLTISANRIAMDSANPFLNITTGSTQRFDGRTTMHTNANFTAHNGGDIIFTKALLGHGEDLNFYSAGTTNFMSGIGLTELGGGAGFGRVYTDAPGETVMTKSVFAESFDIDDPLRLDTNVRMFAEFDADFAQTIDGQNHSFEIQSPFVWFHDHATNFTLLKTQLLKGVGQTWIGPEYDGGQGGDDDRGSFEPFIFIEGDMVYFDHDVHMKSDGDITGHDWVRFGYTLDGTFDTTVNSNHLIRYDGNVGSLNPLATLTNNNDGVTEFRGNLARVFGDIQFNFLNGVAGVPTIATVAGLGGDLTIETINGNLTMAQDQKMTVTDGSLFLRALNGLATLSDLNAHNDINVKAGGIAVQLRDAGQVLMADGSIINDEGVDFVAGGGIKFNTALTTVGTGTAPVFSAGNGSYSNALNGEAKVDGSSLTSSDLFHGETVLDLHVVADDNPGPDPEPEPNPEPNPEPQPEPVDPIVLQHHFHDLIDRGPLELEDHTPRKPFALRPTDRLAIFMRAMTNGELVAHVDGIQVHDDTASTSDAERGTLNVVTNRLRRENVLAVVDLYEELFGVRLDGSPIDENDADAQAGHIRTALADAWTAYAGQTDAATASGFRAFIATNNDHEEARVYIDGLRMLVRELTISGVTPRELNGSMKAITTPIATDAVLTSDQIAEFIAQ